MYLPPSADGLRHLPPRKPAAGTSASAGSLQWRPLASEPVTRARGGWTFTVPRTLAELRAELAAAAGGGPDSPTHVAAEGLWLAFRLVELTRDARGKARAPVVCPPFALELGLPG